MISLVSLLVAAALVSQHSGFEANAQIDNSKLTLDNNLTPNVIHPKKQRRVKKFVHIWKSPAEEVRRVAGERVELECEVMGNPPPAVVWEKNGHIMEGQYEDELNEILPPVSFSLGQLAAKLVITSTTPGEDAYTCVATAGSKRERATSVVYTLPAEEEDADLLAIQKVYQLAPTVTYHYNELLQVMGTTAVLPCRAVSATKPVLFWQDRNHRLIYNNPRMKVLPFGDLVINDLRFDEDMGNFTCIAKNMFGKDSAVTFVYPTKA